MTAPTAAPLRTWITERLSREISQSIERLRRSDDVRHVALMPDVHLAKEVCVGAVVATKQLIYPEAVGGDIGCGMAALAIHANASVISDERAAANLLAGLYEHVPANRHRRRAELPCCLESSGLSDARLQHLAERDGRVQLGTLGRGNHFVEFQADQDGRLWVMIHSGSRAMGQAIIEHHLRTAQRADSGLRFLSCEEGSGPLYLSDAEWARTYARENRLAMLTAIERLLQRLFNVTTDWDSLIHCDHNHVRRERHQDTLLWVHRKGAQSAMDNEPGIVPGSMGTVSFHTSGRGCADALTSCSHGAGRRLSRSEARQQVSGKAFARQVGRLWFDHRQMAKLRDEAPAAYKDIRAVMRAQKDLVRIVRELRPVLCHKGV